MYFSGRELKKKNNVISVSGVRLEFFNSSIISYPTAGVRNLPTTGIPSVDKGFYIINADISVSTIVAFKWS